MADMTLDLLHVRATSFRTHLAQSDSKKCLHVTKQLAENFNRLLEDARNQLSTDEAAHLPHAITFVSNAATVAGRSDVLYVDLEIMVDQLAGILGHLKSSR
jgi:hypothetical protein